MSFLYALILALPAAGPDSTAPAPIPTLRQEAWTPGTRIRLKDLLDPADHSLLAPELLEVDLGRSPSPGFGRLLTREAILAALPEPRPPLAGPDEVTVRTTVTSVSVEDVLNRARDFLAENASLPADSEVELTRAPFEAKVPEGRESLELFPRFRGKEISRGPVTVLTEVRVDGKLQIVIPTTFMVRTFQNLPVLAQNLTRGGALQPDLIRTVRSETTHESAPSFTGLQALFNQEARRDLKAGTPITARDFKPTVLIQRNSAVTLVYERGALRAETYGIARDSGTYGSSIRIENLVTKKTVVGRVVGPGLVQMNP
ncbi:MAG: flagellar basal body P-ring formation chaperone FlgA [Planctomycetota bacterium]